MHADHQGLSTSQAKQRLLKYGENRFEEQRKASVVWLFFSQFTSPFISILLIACVISLLLGDVVDAAVIFLAVMINTVLGFVQEYKAQNALAALSKVLSPQASVIRDGAPQMISAFLVVPDDIVILEEGDQIPADGYFLEERDLLVNEAVLTGESRAVKKHVDTEKDKSMVPGPQTEEADHFAYMGTTVVSGKAVIKVMRTGSSTEVGQIAQKLKQTKETTTPLQSKLSALSRQLALLVGIVITIVFVMGVFSMQPVIEMLKISVAMFVSAIPEGLAISLTAILAVGMQRILHKKALVRKLVAAETLGSVTVICTDKTGTLTTGELSVLRISSKQSTVMKRAAGTLTSPNDELEIAVRLWREKFSQKEIELLDEIPFSSTKKFSAKLTERECFLIGAPDVVLKHCSTNDKKKIEEELLVQARAGYRIVGVAVRDRKAKEEHLRPEKLGSFEWVGYFVLADEIRKDVRATIEQLQSAQIGVKVITGDYAETARAVLEEVGITIHEREVMLGHEFKSMPLSQFQSRVRQTKLFARTTPDQKLSIIQALQAMGEVVAMTGDGVNDAPALKQADIGVVVSTASDVSKETADMVLIDDNFTTLVAAVEEGRGIYENLRKVLLYLLANSFAETIFIIGSIILGLPLPVSAIQILWVNVVTDGLPNIALTLEPKERGLLREPPRSRQTALIDKEIKLLIALISFITGVVILVIFWFFVPSYSLIHARTLAFSLLAVMSLLYVFSSRSLRQPIWQSEIHKNSILIGAVGIGFLLQLAVVYIPFLQTFFKTSALNKNDWVIIFGLALLQIMVVEIVKGFFPKQQRLEDKENFPSARIQR